MRRWSNAQGLERKEGQLDELVRSAQPFDPSHQAPRAAACDARALKQAGWLIRCGRLLGSAGVARGCGGS